MDAFSNIKDNFFLKINFFFKKNERQMRDEGAFPTFLLFNSFYTLSFSTKLQALSIDDIMTGLTVKVSMRNLVALLAGRLSCVFVN